MTGQIQIRTHKESRRTAEELLEAVFFPDLTEYNSIFRIIVSSESQDAETKELEGLITRLIPRNVHIQSAYLTTPLEFSCIT
jgi:hypothetical protein